jgi:hypothetical protein
VRHCVAVRRGKDPIRFTVDRNPNDQSTASADPTIAKMILPPDTIGRNIVTNGRKTCGNAALLALAQPLLI